MKLIILTFFTILFFSSQINSQNKLWWFFLDDDYLKEVTDYSNRVNSNGGRILDKNSFNNQIKLIKSNNYLDSLLFWVSLNGGVKTNSDTISVLFDLKGNDLTSSALISGPLLGKDINFNKPVAVFEGLNSLINTNFISNQPFSLILEIKIDSSTLDKCIMGSFLNSDYSIDVDKKNVLTVESKSKLKDGFIDYQHKIIVIYFDGLNSSIFVDNVLIKSGHLNSVQLEGLLFGMNKKHNPDFFKGYLYTCGIFKSILPDIFRSSLTELLIK